MKAEWDVRETRSNSTGVYYTLNMRTKGTMLAPVTVKHSTRHNRMVCLTCLTADLCPHSRFVRDYHDNESDRTQQETTEQ